MRLLVITGGNHPYHETTPVLSRFLRNAGHTANVSKTAKELSSTGVRGYDAIVLNTRRRADSGNDMPPEQREGLRSYVESGGGLISLHISPDSCPDWPEMKKLTGGGWVSGSSWHPPFGPMKVYVRDSDHPISKGVSDFDTTDECYCDVDIQPGIDVFLGAPVDGVEQPLGWTYSYGKGKIANIALGHAGISQQNIFFQRLTLNAVDFVTT